MTEPFFTETLLVAGVPAVVLVPLVVEAAKRVGLPTRYAPLATLVAAGLVAGAAEALPFMPVLEPVVRWAVATLLLGLGATGAYETTRFLRREFAAPSGQG
ncbi:hypothetical protein NET03_04865 [Thermomicrobium sp. CFH 73360]|uniref:hypothetical protein n=1 Tax=Thermomicrobium sp. CFH 73360 TaxID=2951987 RepID=UPI0020771812|nr:hypothetical protein [Thermomicrobium sp. CFH 73360]MCM8745854.1 hypothetical protein [Thermomicrobium sp. CFH 73360]